MIDYEKYMENEALGIIYRDDIEDMRRANTEISRNILKIQNILTKKFITRID